jgi:hypothetical protein
MMQFALLPSPLEPTLWRIMETENLPISVSKGLRKAKSLMVKRWISIHITL